MENPCDPPPQFWVVTRTVTVSCPPGSVGPSITVTRQGRSCISLAHASELAYQCALKEANLALRCTWTAERCKIPECGGSVPYTEICRQAESLVSQADAQAKAEIAVDLAISEICGDF